MKAPLLSGLALILLSVTAQARPAPHVPGKPHPIMAPLEEAATGCFAETVMANPKAINLAKNGHWYDAAGVIGFLCRPEVGRMIAAFDGLYGSGSGERFFKGAYARHLDRELALRLQPLLETKTVASAEPAAEKAAPAGEITSLADPVETASH